MFQGFDAQKNILSVPEFKVWSSTTGWRDGKQSWLWSERYEKIKMLLVKKYKSIP